MPFRRAFTLAALLSFVQNASAQYFALEYDSVSPYVTVLPLPKDGNYRVVKFDHRFPDVPERRAEIKVYDENQRFVKSIPLLFGITRLNDYPPLAYNNRYYWPANFRDTRSALNNLAVLELDSGYQFVNLHIVSTHEHEAHPTGIVKTPQGFVLGEYLFGPTQGSVSTVLYKLGNSLAVIDSALFTDDLRIVTHHSHNGDIVCAAESISAVCTNSTPATQKVVLDHNLSIKHCFILPVWAVYFCYDGGGNIVMKFPVYYGRNSVVYPMSTGDTYIQGPPDFYTCRTPVATIVKSILSGVLVTTNYNDVYLNYHEDVNTEHPLYFSSSFDFNGSEIVNVGVAGLPNTVTPDRHLQLPYFAGYSTTITVTKQDAGGSLIWRKYYGGDMNYFARSVAFTADGGIVVAGSRYDKNTMPQGVFENFMMKLDNQGNVIHAGFSELQETVIKCYPNPAANELHFTMPASMKATVQLFDCTGKSVQLTENYISAAPIDIRQLEPGMYTYRVHTKNGVFRGKIVKD